MPSWHGDGEEPQGKGDMGRVGVACVLSLRGAGGSSRAATLRGREYWRLLPACAAWFYGGMAFLAHSMVAVEHLTAPLLLGISISPHHARCFLSSDVAQRCLGAATSSGRQAAQSMLRIHQRISQHGSGNTIVSRR